MKKNIFILIAAMLFMASCSLKEKNDSYMVFENYYKNAQQIRSGLNGCYPPLRYFYDTRFWQMTECASDLIYFNSIYRPDANCIISPSDPGSGDYVWHYCYQGISRANEMEDAIEIAMEKGYITADEYKSFMSEVVIARGLYYYFLTCTFNGVPYYTERVTEENKTSIEGLPRTPAAKIRDLVAEEICKWVLPVSRGGLGALPLRRTYETGTDYRFSAALGLMIAGKCYMWNERWDDALTAYSVIEDIYGHYTDTPEMFGKDYPLTDIPFSRRYTPESIWEVPNHCEEYGIQMSGGLAVYITPSRATAEIVDDDAENEDYIVSSIYNGIIIPELGGNAKTVTAARPTAYVRNSLLPYTSVDLRSGEYNNVDDPDSPRGGSGNLAWRWAGYDATDTEQKNRGVFWFTTTGKGGNSTPWLGNKFWCFGMYYTRDTNNYPVFRYAGALLNMAEAYYWMGDSELACKYLNITRVRAGLPPVDPYSVADILSAIQEESAKELFGEFQRKFDLVRWDIWYAKCLTNTQATYLLQYIRPYHKYYPIPEDQVALSHGALKNDEYVQ